MAFRWRADHVPTLNAGFQGIWTRIAKKLYIFVVFQGVGGGVGPPVTSLWIWAYKYLGANWSRTILFALTFSVWVLWSWQQKGIKRASVQIMGSCFIMDMFTLNPHNISHFGETEGHIMDFCGIREASKKLFGM